MRKVNLLIVSVITFFLTIINVSALVVDTNKLGSMTGKYVYDDVSISDANVYLYHVADMNEVGKFTYVDKFTDYTVNINDLKASDWPTYASNLSKYITDKNISPIKNAKTDSTGQFVFKDLKVGLYLMKLDSKKTKNYEYSSGPVLVSLPTFDEVKNNFIYDLSVFAKTEAKSLNVTPVTPGGKDTPDVPYTADTIFIYVGLFGVALVVAVLMILLIKKREKENIGKKDN